MTYLHYHVDTDGSYSHSHFCGHAHSRSPAEHLQPTSHRMYQPEEFADRHLLKSDLRESFPDLPIPDPNLLKREVPM